MTNPVLLSESIELLKQLIRISSFAKEEERVADFLFKYMTMQGWEVQRKGNNLWTIAPGFKQEKPTLLLNSHQDTVQPADGWLTDPFVPVESDGRIYGLGSNDAAGALVSLIQTFKYLSQKNQPYNLILAISAEEEISGINGISSALDSLPPITLGIVGEPTGMSMAVAERGLLVIDAVAKGKSGHAAREEGINAIYKALDDISFLRNYKFDKISPQLGEVKLSVTQIEAGKQHNVVPDICRFVIDIRLNECYSHEDILQTLQSQLQSEIEPRSVRLCSSGIRMDHPIVEKAVTLGIPLYGSPTMSDMAVLPFDTVKIGPGESSRSHTANEFIVIDEIEKGISVYIDLLDGLKL